VVYVYSGTGLAETDGLADRTPISSRP